MILLCCSSLFRVLSVFLCFFLSRISWLGELKQILFVSRRRKGLWVEWCECLFFIRPVSCRRTISQFFFVIRVATSLMAFGLLLMFIVAMMSVSPVLKACSLVGMEL